MISTTFTIQSGEFSVELPTGLFINNEFVPSAEGLTIDVENPATGERLATVAAAGPRDVDKAVTAAKKAYPSWRAADPQEKAKLLWRLAELIERDATSLKYIESLDSGIPITANFFPSAGAKELRYWAGWCDKITGMQLHMPNGSAYTKREPIGVCAAITPWNVPLDIAIRLISPALAAGNVLIMKTPELTPLFGYKLGQLIQEAGFPPGVLNIITGIGNVAGAAIAEHMEIRKLSFVGSGATGRSILRAAAQSNLKRIGLELGGKGATIIFDDAHIPNALFWALFGFTALEGQLCNAGTRIFVQEGIYDAFVAAIKERLDSQHGDPSAPGILKGPIVSKLQLEKILGYIEKGKAEGGTLLGGGSKLGDHGYFVENTVFLDVKPDSTIMKEEIFGPVAVISKFKTEDEVIEAANATTYGLTSSVFSSDAEKIRRVSDALECGNVYVNYWGLNHFNQPYGGVKESGWGRDKGQDALHDWTNHKTVAQRDVLRNGYLSFDEL